MSTKAWCILALALTVLSSASSVAAAAEVYLVPEQSNVSVGTEVAIELWLNATEFKSGQINMTYDSGCVNVTNCVLNETNFPVSGWSHYGGSEWITFMTAERSLTGFYQIGTLTIKCVTDTDCGTRLEFDVASEKKASMLYGANGSISVDWQTGQVECKSEPPETANGDADRTTTSSSTTAADTNETADTNVTSDAKNETAANETAAAPAVNETAANETLQTPPAQKEPQEEPPEVSPEIAEHEHTPATQTPTSTPQSSSVHVIVALAAIVFTAVIISLRRCKK